MVIMEVLHKICLVFTIIGSLNWGLIGLFEYNLVSALFGVDTMLTKLIYIIVGICAVINIGILFHHIDEHPFESK